jgi:hypothetical protein
MVYSWRPDGFVQGHKSVRLKDASTNTLRTKPWCSAAIHVMWQHKPAYNRSPNEDKRQNKQPMPLRYRPMRPKTGQPLAAPHKSLALNCPSAPVYRCICA